MKFEEGKLYHIYNRGNNRQPIFYVTQNYLYFLTKIRKYIRPNCNILAYCLMPNHFHLLIQATGASVQTHRSPLGSSQTILSDGFKNLLSSYTQGINKQQNRTGSLFVQNTRAKLVACADQDLDYSLLCFNYIHQNPVHAGLVATAQEWPYSSFLDYAQLRNGTLCAKEETYNLIDADWDDFIQFSTAILPDNVNDWLY